MREAPNSPASESDNAVAPWKRWIVRAALVATGLALVATSPAPSYSYGFEKSVEGPEVELTSSMPNAHFRVTARALELAPNDRPTTAAAHASVRGSVLANPNSLFVRASATTSPTSVANSMNVLRAFDLAIEPVFSGDCENLDPGATPCESSFDVTIARVDGGSGGGSVRVSWGVDFTASVSKPSPSEEGLSLPWQVEVVGP